MAEGIRRHCCRARVSPPAVNPRNERKPPPRCCSSRWAGDAMIMYSPGAGSAFEKCCRWKKMFERRAAGGAGGADAVIFQQGGFSCGVSRLGPRLGGVVLVVGGLWVSHASAAQRRMLGSGGRPAERHSPRRPAEFANEWRERKS